MSLFDRGAAAVRLVDPSIADTLYFCPICERGFTRDDAVSGELTLEHVPPKARGGEGVLLTCRACNSFAGHALDVHSVNREKVIDFAQGLLGQDLRSARVKTDVGGEDLLGELTTKPDGGISFRPVPEANNPEAIRRSREYLEDLVRSGAWDGHEFKVTPRIRWHPRRASLSDLRAAFLLGFALFGYRYAFHPNLAPVRRQIREPEEEIIAPFVIRPNDFVLTPELVLVAAESPFEALLVLLEREVIILPGIDREYDFYGVLKARSAEDPLASFTGTEYAAPKALIMALDFA